MSQSLGATVRELRSRQGLSARALARALGVSRSFVRQVENDSLRPSASRIVALAHILHTDADHLELLAGRVPTDIFRTLQANPNLLADIRSRAASAPSRAGE